MCIWIRSYKFAMVFLLHLNVKFTLSINIRNSFCRNQMHEISNMATCIIETYLDFYFVYVSSNVRTQIRRQLSLSLFLSPCTTHSCTHFLTNYWHLFYAFDNLDMFCWRNELQPASAKKLFTDLNHDSVTSCSKWTHCKLITWV